MTMYDQGSPYPLPVKAGETVYLCRCGKSANAPLCDGSHSGSGTEPVAHTADKDGDIYACGCGKSANMPFCDGSHSK